MNLDNSKKTQSFASQFQHMTEIESFVESRNFYVTLHGINLQFECYDTRFVQLVQAHLPREMYSFTSEKSVDHKVCWFSAEQLGESWDLGGDHLCDFQDFDFGQVVTQRDFAASLKDPSTHYLVSPVGLDDGFFNFLRFVIPQLMLKQYKFVFHSSGVELDTQSSVLFLGHSGYGKSTICQKFPLDRITGDDMHLLYFEDGKLIVEPTHLGQQVTAWNKIGRKYQVKKLYWLEKSASSDIPEVTELSDSEKRLKLIGSLSGVFWDQLSSDETRSLLQFSQACAEKIDFEILKTSLNSEVSAYVDNSI